MPLNSTRRETLRKVGPLYLLMLPSLLLLVTFFYYPAISGFFNSFFNWSTAGSRWVGLGNYKRLINDSRMIASIGNLAQIVTFNVVVVVTMPLMAAVLMFHLPSSRAQYVYRIIYVFPMIVPGVVVLVIWRWIYSMDGGINTILRLIGLGSVARAWLGERNIVLYAIMFVGFPWMGGLNFLIYLSGLQSIPNELFDAATVDGVRPMGRFFRIELPLISAQIRLLTLLTIIFHLQRFEMQLILTDGGPGWSSMVPGLRMYHTVSRDYNLGYGSAIGSLLFILVFTVTMLQLRLTRKRGQSV
jgi:raffinose/stachyose/melibiose transport system permease protein